MKTLKIYSDVIQLIRKLRPTVETIACRRPPNSGGIGHELADLGMTSVAFVWNATTENERAQVAA